MADLENLLLEAAGRTGGSGGNRRPPSRRRREGSYSDDGSDSKDDDSDDDLGYKSRKPSGSQVPLKKRLDPIEKDDDRDSQGDDDGYEDDEHRGGSSDDSDVGSDLYKGEEDRENLAQMTELEREYILSERATRRDDLKLKETVRAKQSGKKSEPVKETTPPPRLRSSARSADRAAAKDDALNELRLKRKKQQDPEGHWRSKDASRGVSGGWGSSPVKHRGILTASPSSSSQSESQSASPSRDDGSTGDGDLADSDDDRADDGRERPVFEDVKNITIKRSRLAKWLMEPFFEELIVGCFVRVGIGMSKSGKSIYRLCMVRNVDATDPNRQYRLENKTTYKYLNCVWGNESSAARWQMARVSDAAPLVEEFSEWVREVERSGGRMPTRQVVLEKSEAIQKTTNTFVYSAETVKQMLQEKKSATSRPMNVAAEKQRLRREMDVAESRRDEAEMERLQARLQELEAMSRQVKDKDSKAVRLAEMNKKNRAENFKNASELKPVNTSLKAGEAGYDPFSRRWTRSMNYYVSKPGGGDETAASVNGNEVSAGTGSGRNKNGERTRVEAGIAATVAALEAAAGAGKLVDTNAPVDQGTESNSLHDFELPVSLAGLQKFGGPHGAHAGFLARKQKIEATVGCRVPENDGRRHALTLTVSDYKRRRGLL
ncbi:protein RTF1 homolog [Macadamia integrifolia]|uniref:protein RTF1 homolog n=1 Tax=Macadamia integrifolia TaxID=60698 RepID=UPI001C52CA50|nr:protein RTF1 homolog [Macadamia integrifolia]XP_042519976.1 protein RTF1 homolog [Macadamia integrifolia]XP_042519977.1 protein RTF1 homolog [Macadamia integrifolia]